MTTYALDLSFRKPSQSRAASLAQPSRRARTHDCSMLARAPAMDIQHADDVWTRIAEARAQLPPDTRARGVIATDADGTLWSGDVGDDLFHAFVERGTVHPPALEAMRREAREHALSDAGTGPEVARRVHEAYVQGRFPEERVCELMAWCFAGWTRDELAAFARETAAGAGLERRMHPEVLRILERARGAGLEVLLVSASPIAIVVAAGARAGFDADHTLAARSLWSGDVMLPDVERPIPYGPGKVKHLRDRIGDRPLLAAFGDNAFDVAMLGIARVGVAVRPKPRLRDRAAEVPGLVELAPETA
jgi:phosphatidylglycerophosphatase C